MMEQRQPLILDETGGSKVVAALLIFAIAAGAFWFFTFGSDRLDFFTISREMRENCGEGQMEHRGDTDFIIQSMQRDMDKHGFDFVRAEDHVTIFTNVDDTITCQVQYMRTVEFPLVDKDKTLLYTYACRTSLDGKDCDEIDPTADPY